MLRVVFKCQVRYNANSKMQTHFFLFWNGKPKDYRFSMKRFVIFTALVCATNVSWADLVVQQQITTPNYNGVITMKIKGTRIRTDLYAGQPQALSSIEDLSTGETIMLLHKQKLYFKSPGQLAKQTKSPNALSQAPLPRPTGQNQKVGDYDTDLYTWTNSRGITGTIWVAKNYPDYARIRTDYAALDKTAGANNDMTPALSTLPGMAVRSQVAGGGQTIVLALISAKEGPLDSTVFGIPRDYKEVPKLNPVKRAPNQPMPPKASGGSSPKAPAGSTKTTPTTTNPNLPSW